MKGKERVSACVCVKEKENRSLVINNTTQPADCLLIQAMSTLTSQL